MITQIRKADYTDGIRSAGWILVLWLLGLSVSWASLPELRIPAQYGTVKETYAGQPLGQEAKRCIIHIQDAHCNYEAQKNMAQLLEYLVKEQNLKLIMVEGGSGDVSLSFLRGYADGKARQEVAEKYLKEGKISGEEYLDIVSDYPLELYGIEDEALYDAHLASFEKVDSFREEGLKYSAAVSAVVENLKQFIYSEELQALEAKRKKYEEKTLALAEYCRYLKEMAETKGLSLKDCFHLVSFVEVARLEKEIDFKKAELQRNAFIKDLTNLLDENGVRELLAKSQDFKVKKMTAQEYYSFLRTAGEKKIDLKSNYPQLYSYINYIILSKDISAPELLKEIGAMEDKIKDASLANADQRRLAEIDKSLQILAKILNLELTPEDYAYFKANKAQFVTASWVDFLSRNCARYNLTQQPARSQLIDENFAQLEEFYQLGVEREKAFIKNIASKMDESGENLAVLITGGFHTPGVTQMLKDRGYSYVVAAPVITQKSDSSVYFSVLRGEKKQRDESDIEEEE